MKRILMILLLLGLTVLLAYAYWVPTLDAVALIFILGITCYIGVLIFKFLMLTKAKNIFINLLKWLLCYTVLICVLLFNLFQVSSFVRPYHTESVTFSNKTFYLYFDGWFGDDNYEVRIRTNVLPVTTYIYGRYYPEGAPEGGPKFTKEGDIVFFDGTKIYDLKEERIIDEQLENLLRD